MKSDGKIKTELPKTVDLTNRLAIAIQQNRRACA